MLIQKFNRFENFIIRNEKSITGLIIFGGLFLSLIMLILKSYFSGFIITDKTIQSLNSFNKEIIKLEDLLNKSFTNKENLIFKINSKIDPQIYDKYYLERLLIEDIISEIPPYEYNYRLRPLNYIRINDSTFKSLEQLKNKYYESLPIIEQDIKKQIGIIEYGKYKILLQLNFSNSPIWLTKIQNFFFLIMGAELLLIVYIVIVSSRRKKKESEEKLAEDMTQVKEKLEISPKKIRPAWEYANLTLQQYYNKNLDQINSIFKLSIAVMVFGFLLIIFILLFNIFGNLSCDLSTLGIAAGIITEFIGGTFLFIFKSTMSEALHYSKSLEKMNNVGMSFSIIDNIEKTDSNFDTLNESKIELAKEILKVQ